MNRADVMSREAPIGRAFSVGMLERLPKWLNLVPMIIQCLWLGLRYRSLTLPSVTNPAITSGGMVGEGKLEYFATMGAHAQQLTARYTSLVNEGAPSLPAACAAMAECGLDYPMIAKPDIGWCGFGVRIIRDERELQHYLIAFPRGERIILQRFIADEGEAGIFYMRDPDEAQGSLLGILLRHYPRVIGDGVSPIRMLIAADPRLARLGRDGLSEPCCDVTAVPGDGEIVRVTTIGSTRVGGLYRDASAAMTPALSAAIDRVARDMTQFHVGRFDVRFTSMAELREGRGFTIIEVNGAGSEAVHAWDPQFTLREAYGIVFAKQRRLYRLAAKMRARGHRPIGIIRLAQLYRKQRRLIRQYPASN
jgi:hypothetical protein